jgi:hypothetical protein
MKNDRATHVDFGFLRGFISSNPKVMPSNIDMVFERRGYFLFGEWKREGETMSYGQKIVLVNLAKLPRTKVLVITGHTDDKEVVVTNISLITKDGLYKQVGSSADDLKLILDMWYQKVNKEGL